MCIIIIPPRTDLVKMNDSNAVPCRYCTKRSYNCHALCKEYKDFRSARDAANADRKIQREGGGHSAALETALRRDLNRRRKKYGAIK